MSNGLNPDQGRRKRLSFSPKNHSGTLLECQTVCIQISADEKVGPDLGPNCLQRLSADDKNRKELIYIL